MPVLSRAPAERKSIDTPTWTLWLTNLVTAVNEATAAAAAVDASTLTGTTLAANVVNSSLTSVGTLVNLTVTNPIAGSVTGSSGSTTGNAATATALQTARNINGVAFDGTANITVTAAAGALTGATLAANVLASSLTSVGTLTGGATGAGFTVALSTSTITGVLATARGGTSVDIATASLPLGSGQITFPATQNPSANVNTFDDYEEGTWTPNDASGAGLSITVNSSWYRKTAGVVMIGANVTYPATLNASAAVIGGLPFSAVAESGLATVFSTLATAILAYLPGGTTIQPRKLGAAQYTNAELTGATFILSGVYPAA